MMQLSVSGVKELDAMMRGLPSQVQHRILTAIHKKAAEPLVGAAQSLAPFKKGLLKKSIGAVSGGSIQRTGEIGLVTVGPRRKGGYEGFHGHLIERGHKVVVGGSLPGNKSKTGRDGKGRVVGFAPAIPFMEPAFKATKGIVVSRIQTEFAGVLWRYMKRTLKKSGTAII